MSITRTTKRRMSFLSLVLVFLFILSTEARAELYGFAPLSDNSGVSSWMAQQLSVDVTPYGTNQVLFTFKNNIPPYYVASPNDQDGIIGTIFFEDGALFQMDPTIIEDPLPSLNPVDFEPGTNPPSKNFPEGNTLVPPFQTTQFFWASNAPGVENGVNQGESVGIVYDLEDGENFNSVLTAIGLGFTNPDPTLYDNQGNVIYEGTSLRIGMHVQNLGDQNLYSDGFIMTPIPGAVLLGMLGLGVAGLKLRKFA